MTETREILFDAVRRACTPATWSRGVELTRAGVVVGERGGDQAAIFRVATRGGMISPKVTLYPEDGEWECECSSREPACEHVAAAAIAWRRAREEGLELPAASDLTGRVGYRFSRLAGGLGLERVVVRDSGEFTPLESTLAAVASRRVEGPRFVATQADLGVELALGTHRRGLLPPPVLPKLFRRLAGCSDVTLDGRPVRVCPDPLLPRALLDDQGEGFRLSLAPHAPSTERFQNGAVLCGDELRIVGEPRLTAREREELARGRSFGPEAVAELVTGVLPSLRRRIPVEVRTLRLPETVSVKPRIVVDTKREGDELSVLATLIYGDPPTARIDGGRLVHLGGAVPLRDEREERRWVRRLAAQLGLAPGVRAQFAGEQAVAFNTRLSAWDGEIRGGGREYFALAPRLLPRVVLDGERCEVLFESPQPATPRGGSRLQGSAAAADVLRAWREGASLVPVSGGGWAPLPADWLGRFGHRIADLLEARRADGSVPACCASDLVRLCEDLDQPPPPRFEALRRAFAEVEQIPRASLPADLSTPLRPYQVDGVNWLVFLREAGLGAMLADDMGLGKTLQALCAMRGRSLVVCPTSVLHNWADEIARHRPGLTYALYHGPRRALDPGVDVTLTTYAILRLDADRLAAESWDTVVLDEAQQIKNPDSQVAATAYRLEARFRMTLTGTPVENRLDELWSQFHFVNRGLLGGRRDFQERYAEPVAGGDSEAAQRLRERIRPFILRRLKRDVAVELPPRTDMVLHCELTPQEREVYDAIRAATLREVVARLDEGGNVLEALEALLRLRQAACHPALVPGQQADGSSKISLLMEALDNVIAEGHKALVFSQWTSLLDLIEPHLAAASFDWLRLDGSTRDRAEVVRRFQQEGGPPLLIVSLKAGGTGLNLTAADHVFLMDPWWNPAVEDQAADRAHRIGQKRPVMVYRLVATDTVEERLIELQRRKRDLADVALGGADRAAGLAREDLLELLR